MLKIFKNAFSKKKKSHTQSFQLQQQDPPSLQKASTQAFQVIDEQAMNTIEEKYNTKQRRSQSFEVREELPPQQDEFMDYVVQEDDSFFGISLKFSVNEGYLLRINNLSSDMIFKGQILKVPITNQPRFSIVKIPDQVKQTENIWEQNQLSQKCNIESYLIKQNFVLKQNQLDNNKIK